MMVEMSSNTSAITANGQTRTPSAAATNHDCTLPTGDDTALSHRTTLTRLTVADCQFSTTEALREAADEKATVRGIIGRFYQSASKANQNPDADSEIILRLTECFAKVTSVMIVATTEQQLAVAGHLIRATEALHEADITRHSAVADCLIDIVKKLYKSREVGLLSSMAGHMEAVVYSLYEVGAITEQIHMLTESFFGVIGKLDGVNASSELLSTVTDPFLKVTKLLRKAEGSDALQSALISFWCSAFSASHRAGVDEDFQGILLVNLQKTVSATGRIDMGAKLPSNVADRPV